MPSPGEDIQSWSTVAANNGTADTLINWAEGQARASVNNSARSMMAAHAKNRNLLNGSIVTTGTGNAQAFLSGLTYTTIPTNLVVRLKVGPGLTNVAGSGVTLNMDGLGATEIKTTNGDPMRGGELCADGYVDLLYNGTNWIFLYSEQFISNRFTEGGGIIIGKQIFTTAGAATYTPTDGMECCIIECVGGGAGGGAAQADSDHSLQGGGGGAGGYSRKYATAAEVGASQAVTVGAGGSGSGSTSAGTSGGQTSVGSLCIANGGTGGSTALLLQQPGCGAGASTVGAVGDVTVAGTPGGYGFYSGNVFVDAGVGNGGSGPFGGGGASIFASNGGDAAGYGGGGAGGHAHQSGATSSGGAGKSGIVIITEFAGRGAPGRDGATGPTGPIGPTGPSGAGTGDVLRSGTPTVGQVARWTDASHIQGVGSDTIGFGPPQGRLSLVGLTPVITNTFAAATAIAYSAYVGDKVPIYDGTNWTMMVLASGFASAILSDTSKNPAAIGASKVNDWFIWNDSGTIRLSHGPDWTNDTTRSAGTALTRVNGIYLNSVSITNACAASRGTYVGTTRSNGTSTLDWIFGAAASGGTAAVFGVWNAYNRVPVGTIVSDSTDSWTYAVTTWRAANASSTMRVSYVCGLQEDSFAAEYCGLSMASIGGVAYCGIGYDATSAYSGLPGYWASSASAAQLRGTFRTTSLGYHFMQAIENSAIASVTFYGDAGLPANIQSGLIFDGRM